MSRCLDSVESRAYSADFEVVLSRIERIEKANRRLKFIVGALSATLLVCMISGAQPKSVPATVIAKEFVLVDANGNSRATLLLNPFDDTPSLNFHDSNRRASSTLDGDGLTFHPPALHPGQMCSFGRDNKGNARILFTESKGNESCSVGITSTGSPYLKLSDHKGQARIAVTLNPELNDAPDLRLLDSAKSVRISIGMGGTDQPMLRFKHNNQRDAITLGMRPDASSELNFYSGEGKEQIKMQLGVGSGPSLRFLGTDDSAGFKAPLK